MNILMLLDGEFPPDSRVEKEALSLLKIGHSVTIACYTRSNAPTHENYKGITIKRIKIGKLTYKLGAACLVIPYYFWIWKKFVNEISRKFNPDVVHVHDLPLSAVGLFISKKYQAKLVCDQHEFYSDWIVHTAHMNTIPGKIVKTLSRWKKYEKKYLTRADLVITVAEPLRVNYIKSYRIDPEKIITIPNTPSAAIYNRGNVKNEIVSQYQNDFVIFYAGGIDILRGIDTAIKALAILKNRIPNIKLVLAGKIIKPYNPFEIASRHNVGDLVNFVGWIDEEDLPSYISLSKICFFTPPVNRKEINNTIATKIYQYAIMGKPIITSNAKMMSEFIKNNRLGYVIKDGDHESFADAVLKSQNDFQTDESIRRILFEMTWEKTVEPLLSEYRKFDDKE